MTEKNIGLECDERSGTYMVTERRARREECPNCHSTNTTVLDALPEDG